MSENREQNLECRGDSTMICIADRKCLFISRCGRALGAVIFLKFQAEPDEGPIAMNHIVEVI
jgi:hypothetical protein